MQSETIVLIFAELGRFDKTEEECVTDLDRMCYLLKHMGSFESQPLWLQAEVYTRIFRACEISLYSKEKQDQLRQDMYDERKWNDIINTYKHDAYTEGELKGRTVGHAEGRAEGHAEGLAQGHAEGEKSKAIEIARKLLSSGFSAEQTAEMTGLSADAVSEISQTAEKS